MGDVVLDRVGKPWDVIKVDHRPSTNRVTMVREGKTFPFTPVHDTPRQCRRGDMGRAIDILAKAFPGLEILS